MPTYRTVRLTKPSAGTAAQTIRLGENLTDYLQQSSTEPLYTACVAEGASVILGGRVVSGVGLWVSGTYQTGATSIDLQLDAPEYITLKLESGDRLRFGTRSNKGMWSVAVSGTYDVAHYPNFTTVELDQPLPDGITSGDAVLLPKEGQSDARPLTLRDLSDRTVTVDGRTYKKVGDMVYDSAAVARYGLKTMTISDGDQQLALDLMNQAIHELRQNISPSFTLTIKGVDMAMYSTNRQHLRAGDSVRVISEPHGVDEVMVVRSMTVDIDNPANTSYTIGKAMPTATGQIRGAYGAAASVKELLTRPNR